MALNDGNEEQERINSLKDKIESAAPLGRANYVSVEVPADSNVLRIGYVDMARKLSVAQAALGEIRTRLLVNSDLHHYFSDVIAYVLGFNAEPPDPTKYDIEAEPTSGEVVPEMKGDEILNEDGTEPNPQRTVKIVIPDVGTSCLCDDCYQSVATSLGREVAILTVTNALLHPCEICAAPGDQGFHITQAKITEINPKT